MTSRAPIGVGVVGLGRIGQLHARNLAQGLPDAKLVAVADADLRLAQRVGESLRVDVVCGRAEQLFADARVEAVVICSSSDTHAGLIEQAAGCGKDIFCEKPLALDLEQADRALAAVEIAGVGLQIGFNRRFDATFRRIRQGIEAGEIGEPLLVRITSRDPHLPPIEYLRESGGLFLDMTIHDFDMARYLVGDEVVELYAAGAARIDPQIAERAGDIDTAMITLKFAGGGLGSIDNCRQTAYGYDQRVEVFGREGCLKGENASAHHASLVNAAGQQSAGPLDFFLDRYPDSYLAEMQEFIKHVRGEGDVSVSGRDGRASLALALAAQRSLDAGRPVRLDES